MALLRLRFHFICCGFFFWGGGGGYLFVCCCRWFFFFPEFQSILFSILSLPGTAAKRFKRALKYYYYNSVYTISFMFITPHAQAFVKLRVRTVKHLQPKISETEALLNFWLSSNNRNFKFVLEV